MSWSDYITNLMASDVQDACICGFNPPSVWAAHPGGSLSRITPAEISALAADDRSSFFINGLTLGAVRCSVIRDNIIESHTLDMRTKATEGATTYNVCVYRACTAFVIVMGKEGVHGGAVNEKAYCMGKYLRDQGL